MGDSLPSSRSRRRSSSSTNGGQRGLPGSAAATATPSSSSRRPPASSSAPRPDAAEPSAALSTPPSRRGSSRPPPSPSRSPSRTPSLARGHPAEPPTAAKESRRPPRDLRVNIPKPEDTLPPASASAASAAAVTEPLLRSPRLPALSPGPASGGGGSGGGGGGRKRDGQAAGPAADVAVKEGECLFHTACYRTSDSIESFRVKVWMKKVADRHVHPMGLSSHSFSLLNETRISMVGVPSLPPAQEVIFKWQRKVEKPPAFAPAAIPLPGTQQSGRWSVLTNLLRRPAPSTPPPAQPSDQATLEKPRFYTYVDSDGYVDKEVQDRHYTTARRELASPLARKVLSPIYERENVIDPKMPHINAHSPHHINHHTVLHKDEIMNASCKEMHLMAYILYEVKIPKTAIFQTQVCEKRLCTIKYYDNGVITMMPGLSGKNDVYQFQIHDDVYHYKISNVSKLLTEADEEQEWKIYDKFYQSRTTSRRAHVPTTFLSPPSALPNALRLTLFGTIHTARSFRSPCARLYIHYLVDFDDAAWSSGSVIDVIVGPSSSSSSSASPTAAAAAESPSSPFSPATEDAKSSTTAAGFGIPHRWMRRLMNGGAGAANPLQPNCVVRKRQDLLAAYTQCSTCTFNEDADAWEARFGLPIEVELTTMRNGSRLKWPRLYVEVCSMDSWDRHVVEGYSYVEIPRTAGCFNLELPTWRPVTTPAADMKSMLIGGSSELEDITYGAIPNGHKGSKLIKYGFQCETSGMVELSLNVVLQSSDLRKPKERGGGGPEKRDVDPTAYLKENASSISDALSRARARMQSLRSREDYTSSRDDSRNGSF